MIAKHTLEPWETDDMVEPGDISQWTGILNREEGGVHAYVNCEANSQRIIACVNACEGIADPAELRKQRDELLATCKTMIIEFDIAHMESAFDGQISAWNNACAVVAQVDGG